MSPEEYERHFKFRKSKISIIIANPEAFQVCDHCRSICPRTYAICPFCHAYRFSHDPLYLQLTIAQMVKRPMALGDPVAPRIPAPIKKS